MTIACKELLYGPKLIHKDVKQAAGIGLKSAIASTRTNARREVCVARSSVQRYAELPSLRYGATPTPTATQLLGSGPLRVSVRPEGGGRRARRSTSFDGRLAEDGKAPGCGALRGTLRRFGEGTPPAVRRVHFAELPPKLDRGEIGEGRAGEGAGAEAAAKRMKQRVAIPSTDGNSASSDPRVERLCLAAGSASFPPRTRSDAFTLGNNGAVQGGTGGVAAAPLAGKQPPRGHHDTAGYRQGTLAQVAATTAKPRLPPLLRAARDGDEDELADVLRRAVRPEDVNAADASGRTALSYIASNGDLKTLEGILRLPGVDVNKQDNEGNTPLHFAAQAGQVEAISYMVSACRGLDIDARNGLGFTPLMKAALQGRTKCAKLLLCAGASPVMRDSGRGLRAEQWARHCGRYGCADVIEKFSRSKLLDRNCDYSRWGSEPELAARLLGGKMPLSHTHQSGASTSLKSKLRKAFRSTSNPGHESCSKSFSVVSHLTSAALCASSPVLPSAQNAPPPARSLVRPLAVPRVQITLAAGPFAVEESHHPPAAEPIGRERSAAARPTATTKKKQ